jgi:hypothetical protein
LAGGVRIKNHDIHQGIFVGKDSLWIKSSPVITPSYLTLTIIKTCDVQWIGGDRKNGLMEQQLVEDTEDDEETRTRAGDTCIIPMIPSLHYGQVHLIRIQSTMIAVHTESTTCFVYVSVVQA